MQYELGDLVLFKTPNQNNNQNTGEIIEVNDNTFDNNIDGKEYTIKDTNGSIFYTGYTDIHTPNGNVKIIGMMGNKNKVGGRRKRASKRKIMRKKSTRRRK